MDMDISHSDEDVEKLAEENRLEIGGEEESLKDVMKDIAVAHKELSDYKKGASRLTQSLDERIIEARAEDDNELVALLTDMKDSANAVHLRLERGEAELRGERGGKYSGLYEPEE